MDYRVVIIEGNPAQSERIANVVRDAEGFRVVSTFNRVAAALGQGSMFRPNVFLMDIDERENIETVPEFLKTYPNTILLCMMEHWNPDSAEQCMNLGATGCIIKPIRGEEIAEAINIFTKRGSTKPARVIAFFSPKGRSAKTTLVANLALSLAHESGEAVGIIDADLQFGDMPIFFDVEPASTIVEAVRDVSVLSPLTLSPYFMPIVDGLYMLSSPKRPELADLVDRETLIEIVRMSGNIYRYVLIDLPSGVDSFIMGVCEFADTIVLSGMIGTGFEIKHMQRSLEMFQGWSDYGKNIHVVFSRVDPCDENERKKLANAIGNPVSAILPNEYLLMSAANSGRILDRNEVSEDITKRFDKMAQNVIAGNRGDLL